MEIKIDPSLYASGTYSAPDVGLALCANEPTVTLRERITSRTSLYVLLHELGHHHWIGRGFQVPCDRDIQYMSEANKLKRIREEIRAWGYVVGCIKTEYEEEIFQLAQECLKGYIASSQVFWPWEEVRELIKKDAETVG